MNFSFWTPTIMLSISVSASWNTACADEPWKIQTTNVTASLRGLSVVDANVVWASGTGGTVIRTTDGGQTWHKLVVDGAESLDFRDIHAFDAERAVIISAGQPARVYRTEDAGKSWKLCFEHPSKKAFFDALSFWDQRHGIAMSDPIDGHVLLIETMDGGNSWSELARDQRPKTLRGEAGFAASGTNMRVVGETVLIALGGGEEKQQEASSRIVYSSDRGKNWKFSTVPIMRNQSSGVFSIDFIDSKRGAVVGGNYLKPESVSDNVAVSKDGGKSWQKPTGKPPRGYRSGVAHFNRKRPTFICVGPGGTDISIDEGNNWSAASDLPFHAVAFDSTGEHGWTSGADGRVAKWIGKSGSDRQP